MQKKFLQSLILIMVLIYGNTYLRAYVVGGEFDKCLIASRQEYSCTKCSNSACLSTCSKNIDTCVATNCNCDKYCPPTTRCYLLCASSLSSGFECKRKCDADHEQCVKENQANGRCQNWFQELRL